LLNDALNFSIFISLNLEKKKHYFQFNLIGESIVALELGCLAFNIKKDVRDVLEFFFF
jgi:hypothetical protein